MRKAHSHTNIIVRREVFEKINDNEYTNNQLNLWCAWAIKKYDTEVIDLIISLPDFKPTNQFISAEQLNRFVFFNDIKRFKLFLDKIGTIRSYQPPHGYDSGSYGLMKDICWYNKIEFLKLIIDIPNLDFSRNDFMIVKKTFKNGHYEALSMLLQYRDEIKNNKELYEKYSFVLRNQKLNQLKEKIYTNK